MSGTEDAETQRRDYRAPYTPHHPIPTISKYREEKEQRRAYAGGEEPADVPSRTRRAIDLAKDYTRGDDSGVNGGGTEGHEQPCQAENKNTTNAPEEHEEHEAYQMEADRTGDKDSQAVSDNEGGDIAEDTTQGVPQQEGDPRKRRKQMKKRGGEGAEREVTDPVTHLPVRIHDFTRGDLKGTPDNEPPPGQLQKLRTDQSSKSQEEFHEEQNESQDSHSGMEMLFPPPSFEYAKKQLMLVYQRAMIAGLELIIVVLVMLLLLEKVFGLAGRLESKILHTATPGKTLASLFIVVVGLSLGTAVILGVRMWVDNKIQETWENEVWEAERQEGKKKSKSHKPESTQWLNSLLASIWPLVNPDLFTSLADTLEDVMQASLPKMVRMVSVDDLGQGSESIRILGVRWLPTGAATQSVNEDGKLEKNDEDPKKSDRTVPGQGEVQVDCGTRDGGSNDDKNADRKEGDSQEAEEGAQVATGMEAEEGDFVNLEIAFAYRARAAGRGVSERAKNAHIYLAFYLPGNIKFPVWAELRGIVGTIRLRLQLTPDPPFFSLCTLTFLGQPNVSIACTPLTRRGLNIMDLPLLSNFVQSSVDAAVAEYVAPKSLTLDLKDMLVGDDFKKDTAARGVLIIKIKRGFDFKEGDPGMGFLHKGSSDPYVSCGWAKFGKPVWSTRVILSDMEPYWEETAFVLVTPEELNVDERLRVQLWDSDRTTADDDLGRIEIDLKKLMKDKESNGRMSDRADGFKALKAGEGMPGKLEWSVGYFSKTRILDEQLKYQMYDPDINTVKELKDKVYRESERKLRETKKDETAEIEQQKAQDLKAREDELQIHAPPPSDYPTGILSIQIHQITGLELEAINKNQQSKQGETNDETEEGDDLPSAYCTIILNHQKIFRTRTKPKNSKPFFNAGCERLIRDWRHTEIYVSVRDARVHEDDSLIGIVHLPLGKVFEKRSQVNDFFPLAGGVGYGRARISMVWRSVQCQMPRELLGWEYGTVEIAPKVKVKSGLDKELRGCRLKFRTSLTRGKMQSTSDDGDTCWTPRKNRTIRLPVRKRYSSPLMIEFRHHSAIHDSTPAFSVFWLKDIPDDEKKSLTLPVWKGDLDRAEKNCMPEYGEKVGEIELNLTFWSGLGPFHEKLASKDRNLADIMDVIAVAQDNQDVEKNDIGAVSHDGGSSSSSSSSDSGDDEADGKITPTTNQSNDSLASNGKRGPIDQLKDYKKHRDQLRRQNRGAMQWKGPRTLQWLKHKAENAEGRLKDQFKHHDRETGIETEV